MRTYLRTTSPILLAGCIGHGLMIRCVAQEQYPQPLLHTATNHPAARVLLLSVDGLHAADLANWVALYPQSALAALSARGVTYTNAHTPMADPAAGLLALTTGGTPISTGILSSDGYDRGLSPPGSRCKKRGTALDLNASFAHDGSFNAAKAPLHPQHGCTPLAPHELLRVNTIFEIVREKIGPTAWAGESAATTDLLQGPSGKGLSEVCGASSTAARADDAARVRAILHWIDGSDCAGDSERTIPVLFGMSFTALAMAQETPGMGYLDAAGTPGTGVSKALQELDRSIDTIVRELKTKQLYDSTWIVVTAPFGLSPRDQRRQHPMPLSLVRAAVESAGSGLMANLTGGSTAMIWLRDSHNTSAVVRALSGRAAALGIEDIYAGPRLALTLRSPANDTRMPDILLQPVFGVRWTAADNTLYVPHGGMLDEETHVALLVSGAQLTGRSDPTDVPTTQLAPLLLRALGLEKFDLQALHQEHSPALPGIF